MVWYHGTPHEFELFDAIHLGKGTDQLGSGFYFTDKESTARGYSLYKDNEEGRILVAELTINNPLPLQKKFSKSEIQGLLQAAPDFDDMLTNFGDVDFEGKKIVFDRATKAYMQVNSGDDSLYVLNTISNDFWGGSEGLFLRAVHEITGFDGLIRQSGDETHAVVWMPEQIRVLRVEPTMRNVGPGF